MYCKFELVHNISYMFNSPKQQAIVVFGRIVPQKITLSTITT